MDAGSLYAKKSKAVKPKKPHISMKLYVENNGPR